jgi:lysozyme family protein
MTEAGRRSVDWLLTDAAMNSGLDGPANLLIAELLDAQVAGSRDGERGPNLLGAEQTDRDEPAQTGRSPEEDLVALSDRRVRDPSSLTVDRGADIGSAMVRCRHRRQENQR